MTSITKLNKYKDFSCAYHSRQTHPFKNKLKEIAEGALLCPKKLQDPEDLFNTLKTHKISFSAGSVQSDDIVLLGPPSSERCKPEYREMGNMNEELKKNFELAEEIFDYVTEKVPHSANFNSKTLNRDDPRDRNIARRLNKAYDNIKYNQQDTISKLMTISNNLYYITANVVLAKEIEQIHVGNCFDLAIVGEVYAWKKHPDKNVERMNIKHGCHGFLLIGRPPHISLEDLATDRKNYVILDIWAEKYYPLEFIEKELYDMIAVGRSYYSNGTIEFTFPILRPFNLERQGLILRQAPTLEEKFEALKHQNMSFNELQSWFLT